MSDTRLFVKPCPEIQDRLEAVYLDNQFDPQFPRPNEISLVQWLMSEENTTGIRQKVIKGNGKKQRVELLYTPRMTLDEVTTSGERSCNSDGEIGDKAEIYEMDDRFTNVTRSWDLDELAEACESDEMKFERDLLHMMSGLDRKLDLVWWSDIPARIGSFAADEDNVVADVKTVATQLSGQPNRRFLSDIEFAAMNAGYPVNGQVLFGYNEIWKAMKDLENGCCADGGTDLGSLFRESNVRLFQSSNVVKPSVFGTDNFIQFMPMAVQPLVYNKYVTSPEQGLRHKDDDMEKRSRLMSPFTGMEYDFLLTTDCDSLNPTVQLGVDTKLIGLPDDMFDIGDRLEGVTYVNRYDISNT